ncbi:hypothetical protein MTX78_08870 [Hymenobacter tibetensis]|uniref:Uncharacterized protein n=1 Tax=Hymenobacter tibetensis TaxID=497967 RepID=A0ABY4D2D9_9BACT|nr:hypothetical protein [Hymenobacter tibetensis]UOG76701.1 hypothetical protein MTX78_08870 [Hymenobacter tibetensis]
MAPEAAVRGVLGCYIFIYKPLTVLGELLSDLLGDVIINSISDSFLALIGFVYLYGRYWQPQKVRAVLMQQHDNRHATAGAAVTHNFMQMVGVVLLLAFWIFILVVVSRHGWS